MFAYVRRHLIRLSLRKSNQHGFLAKVHHEQPICPRLETHTNVHRSVLIEKLSPYGIQGSFSKWFRSDLIDRVKLNYCVSDVCVYFQGLILGPLIFSTYVSDLAYNFFASVIIILYKIIKRLKE